MTLKHLRVFVKVYELSSITEAAKALHMTQPATSLAMRELEEEYHTKLFERSGRGIVPTGAAAHMYEYAARTVSSFEELDEEMRNWNVAGKLRLGSSISIGTCLLPEFLKKYTYRYPALDAYVRIDSSDVIERMIVENKLDFALIENSAHSGRVISESFYDDSLIAICGRFHKLADKAVVTLEDLAKERLLLREPNSGTRQLVDSTFLLHGHKVRPVWESTSTAALIQGVKNELGISILPKRMLETYIRHHEVVPLKIENIEFKRHYHIIYHENKYITEPMQAFMDMIKELSHE